MAELPARCRPETASRPGSGPPPTNSPGTYVLLLEAARSRRLRVGALGWLEVAPGFYAYVGSARGPGGLSARIGHHRWRTRSPHWHIDYLRPYTALREVWFVADPAEWEHRFARVLEGLRSARVPLPRFGATDCRCRAHLFHFSRPPGVATFRRRLAPRVPGTGAVSCPRVARWSVG